jgi:hypothetical protein
MHQTVLATLKLASRSLHEGGAQSDVGIFQSLGRILISLLGTYTLLRLQACFLIVVFTRFLSLQSTVD